MSKPAVAFRHNDGGQDEISIDSILNALPTTVIVLDAAGSIVLINTAGEQFLQGGAKYLKGRAPSELLPQDNPVFSLISQVRKQCFAVSENRVTL